MVEEKKVNQYPIEQLYRIAIFLGTLFVLYFVWLQKGRISTLSQYGYLGVFLINFIASATVFLPLPGVAAVFLGGALWNPFLVGISAGVGAGIGELSGYLIGYSGRGLLSVQNKNKWLQVMQNYFQKNGFLTTFIIALIPLPFFDFIGVFAGAMNYPIWKFTTAVVLGRTIRDIIIAWSGAEFLQVDS